MQCKRSGKSLFTYAGTIIGVVAVGTIHVAAQDCPWREYAWTRTVGGEAEENMLASVAIDNEGRILIAGDFGGKLDFDPGAGKDVRRPKGHGDSYVTWYGLEGSYGGTYTFGASGGSGYLFSSVWSVQPRPSGGFAIGGYFSGKTDFDPSERRDNRTSNGSTDAFVTLFRADMGHDWTWVAGGLAADLVAAISVGLDGSMIAAGYFSDRMFLGDGENRHEVVSNGDLDVFIAKLSPAGAFLWSTVFGGPGRDAPYAVTTDGDGNVLIAGGFRESVDFDPNGQHAIRTSHGGEDMFVLKLDSGGRMLWLRVLGGERSDQPLALAVAPAGDVYAAGFFSKVVDFDPDGGGDIHDSGQASNHAFVTRYSGDGSYLWTRSFGGNGSAGVSDLQLEVSRLVLTGNFSNIVDFDPGEGIDERSALGQRTCFVSYWTPDGNYGHADVFGGAGLDRSMGIRSSGDGSVYVAGDFNSQVVDFDPTFGVSERNCRGSSDIFLSKFECGRCEFVDRHDLLYDENVLHSIVYTLAPRGKVTVVLASDAGELRKSKRIDVDGRAKIKFSGIAPGEYRCSVRRVRNEDGEDLCEGWIAERRIVVP